MTEKERLNGITRKIIGAALTVHRALGPVKLESAYTGCLAFELEKLPLHIERQKAMPLVYSGAVVKTAYRLDLVVEDAVIVEEKAVNFVTSVHCAQLRSYLRLSQCKVGLLINFNVTFLTRDGITRIVNKFPD